MSEENKYMWDGARRVTITPAGSCLITGSCHAAELNAVLARAEKAEALAAHLRKNRDALEASYYAKDAELAVLREDKARLDWLTGPTIYCIEIQNQPHGNTVYKWDGSKLRAAIDAARKAKS